MKNLKDFIQGEFNKTLESVDLLNEDTKNQAEDRQLICGACQFLDKNTSKCTKCGCRYPDLTFAPEKKCPMNYWGEMIKNK